MARDRLGATLRRVEAGRARSALRTLAAALLWTGGLAAPGAERPLAGQLAPERAAQIDRLVFEWVEEHDVVGLQIAVGSGDEVVWTGAYSMADLEHDVPMTDETRLRTASISKWMTATAALRLVELGRLDLDVPVREYCPAYPEKRWPLTLTNLLRHRGGVRHYWGANGEDPQTPEARWTLREKQDEERAGETIRYDNVVAPVSRFAEDPLLFEPGTDYRYTSLGYRLVGCVLRGAAGTSYDEVMREHVFGPAGMTRTRNDDAFAIIPDRARGYLRGPDGEPRRSRFRDVSENLPAGGHVSTASDLVRFALAWNGGRLISEASRALQTARPPGAEEEAYYGFGVNVGEAGELGGRVVHLHTGSQAETRTILLLLPDEGIAIAAMSNDEDVPSLGEIVLRALEALERS